jgi:hypothetical protein
MVDIEWSVTDMERTFFQGAPGTAFETIKHMNDVFWHLKSHIDSYIHSAIVAQPQTKECRHVPSFCS